MSCISHPNSFVLTTSWLSSVIARLALSCSVLGLLTRRPWVGCTTHTTSPQLTWVINTLCPNFPPPNTPSSFLLGLLPCLTDTYRVTTLLYDDSSAHHEPHYQKSAHVNIMCVRILDIKETGLLQLTWHRGNRQPLWEDWNQSQSPKPRPILSLTQTVHTATMETS